MNNFCKISSFWEEIFRFFENYLPANDLFRRLLIMQLKLNILVGVSQLIAQIFIISQRFNQLAGIRSHCILHLNCISVLSANYIMRKIQKSLLKNSGSSEILPFEVFEIMDSKCCSFFCNFSQQLGSTSNLSISALNLSL